MGSMGGNLGAMGCHLTLWKHSSGTLLHQKGARHSGSIGGILLNTVYILWFMGGILGPMGHILGLPLALTYLNEIGASRRLAKIELFVLFILFIFFIV